MTRVANLMIPFALTIDLVVAVWAFDLRGLAFADAAVLNGIRFNATLFILTFGGGGALAGWAIDTITAPASGPGRAIVSALVVRHGGYEECGLG
jgi:hypothetical protein